MLVLYFVSNLVYSSLIQFSLCEIFLPEFHGINNAICLCTLNELLCTINPRHNELNDRNPYCRPYGRLLNYCTSGAGPMRSHYCTP